MSVPLPAPFIKSLTANLGPTDAQALCAALNNQPTTSVRLNPAKTPLHPLFSADQPVRWCADGRYLETRPSFTLDPRLHAGGYYVQEASSMIVGEIARTLNPTRILDLCAAPGGKSTHLSSILSPDGLLVANEVVRPRAGILLENVVKWGAGNTVVTNSDPSHFGALAGFFDLMVIDAPCSGEGMFRKDVESRNQWSPQNVELCASRAKRIVSDAWDALQTDGVLIYSTCTFNRAENEDTIQWICETLGAQIIDYTWPENAIVSSQGAHFYPHKTRGEGFFCSVLRKTSFTASAYSKRPTRTLATVAKNDISHLETYTNSPLEYRLGGESIYGYTPTLAENIDLLMSTLNVQYSGVKLGEMIRGTLKPAHSLSVYADVKYENVSDLTLDQALTFLRKNNGQPNSYADGLSLVRYEELALGWAKKIGNRVNNNYPPAWRVHI